MKGSRDLLLVFWNPSISQKLLKLKTSNLVCRLALEVLSKKSKIRSKGVVKGSRDVLLNVGSPFISR